MPKRKTEIIELVETHAIYLSLSRLRNSSRSDWKRALYHAVLMEFGTFSNTAARIREALEIP